MKKLFKCAAILLSALAVTPLWSCTTLKERDNTFTISTVGQYADGTVYAELDYTDVRFGENDYYFIQFSVDGGSTWAHDTAAEYIYSPVERFTVLTYDEQTGKYYLGSPQRWDPTVVNVNPGDELEVTMRLAADEKYKVTEQCNTVKYTLKELSPAGAGMPKIDNYSSKYQDGYTGGGSGDDYTFEKQPDGSFKLRRLVYEMCGEDLYNVTHGDLQEEDLGIFEYKFYTFTEEEKNDYDWTYWALVQQGAEENEIETSGWTDYNDEVGIPLALCQSRAATVYSTRISYGVDGEIVSEERISCSMAAILVRYKGHDNVLRSIVAPVHLQLTDWVVV